MKWSGSGAAAPDNKVAPHAGAWIEIATTASRLANSRSPPTRGRGLKYQPYAYATVAGLVAPHAGAWIEIWRFLLGLFNPTQSRPPRGGVD